MITPAHYVFLAAVIFAIGVMGVILRREAVIIFMSIELMLNAGGLAFVAASRYVGNLSGQVFVFFVIAVAAAEVAVGLALLVLIFRQRFSTDVDHFNVLKW